MAIWHSPLSCAAALTDNLANRVRPGNELRLEGGMKSRWVDSDAQAAVDHYARLGIGNDVALRVYTPRLLGQDPQLVLHGGGNTSVKTRMPDLVGEETEVLYVKGSGADMGTIEPAALPAVRLAPLRKLRALDTLADDELVRIQRANLI